MPCSCHVFQCLMAASAHLQPRDGAGVFGRLALGVVEIRRHRNHRRLDLLRLAQVPAIRDVIPRLTFLPNSSGGMFCTTNVFRAAHSRLHSPLVLPEYMRHPGRQSHCWLHRSGTHACAVSRILASTMDDISSAEKRFFSPLYSTAQTIATHQQSDVSLGSIWDAMQAQRKHVCVCMLILD